MSNYDQVAAPRQYYYKNNECHAANAESEDCICWHDEGTGPMETSIWNVQSATWRTKPMSTEKNAGQSLHSPPPDLAAMADLPPYAATGPGWYRLSNGSVEQLLDYYEDFMHWRTSSGLWFSYTGNGVNTSVKIIGPYQPTPCKECERLRSELDSLKAKPAEPQPTIPEGFTPHDGKGMPVDGNCKVVVVKRSGYVCNEAMASHWSAGSTDNWVSGKSSTPDFEIIAYKVVEPAPNPWVPVPGSWVQFEGHKVLVIEIPETDCALLEFADRTREWKLVSTLSPWIEPRVHRQIIESLGERWEVVHTEGEVPVVKKAGE